MNYDYVKAILYAYPALGEIGDAMGTAVNNKALLSYKNPRATEEVAAEIVTQIAVKRALEELCDLVDCMLGEFSEEERFLLEYKYFRRKKVLRERYGEHPLDFSERNYFRKQNRLLEKAADYIFEHGWTQERFLRETDGLFLKVLRAIGCGRECRVRGQRKRGIFFHSSP